jgi:hypothetical protein
MTDTPTPGRGPGKRFRKGQSGNPGGRPRTCANAKEVRERAQSLGVELIDLLFAQAKANLKRAPSVAHAAIVELLNRGYGRPESTTTLQGVDGTPLFPQPTIANEVETARRVAFVLHRGVVAAEELQKQESTATVST